MKKVDLIIFPKWLVPVDQNHSILENHAVVVDKSIIIEVGGSDSVLKNYTTDNQKNLPDHALIPGLINAHNHSAMTLFRGYADDLPLMEWLSEHIWPAESKWVDANFVEAGSRLACIEMIKSGTTCFNDMYFFPDIVAGVSESAGLRTCIGMIVIDFPTVWAQNSDEYINKGLAVRDEFRHSTLVSCAFAPHAPYTVSDEPLRKIATLCEELDCQVHMHIHETKHEVEESTARYGMRPLERLDQLGILSPRLNAVHMTQLLAGEIETIADRGVSVIHCPESNLKLASGFCPVSKLMEAGVNLALGTDGASSNNDLDMLSEMKTASLLAKGFSSDPTSFSAYQVLESATLNGARALGLDEIVGSIESGKQADMVAIDLSHCATQPVYHPVSQILYSGSRDQISDVWVSGNQLLENYQLTTLDLDETIAVAAEWQNKINQ